MSATASSSNSSKVQLTLMSLFRSHGTGDDAHLSPLVGAEAVWQADGRTQVIVASVPFHHRAMDARAPQKGRGLLALFGIRDAIEELQHWRTVARNSQAQFTYIQLQVDVRVAHNGVVSRQILQERGDSLRFLNVRRCAADMQKAWLAQFATWVQQEGGDAQRDMQQVRQMARRPDLFERLLHEDPDLQHIDVMVLPLSDRPEASRTRQVAYVRAGARLAAVTQGSDQVQVHLPDWMHVPSSMAA